MASSAFNPDDIENGKAAAKEEMERIMAEKRAQRDRLSFSIVATIAQIVILALFCECTTYDEETDPRTANNATANHGLHVYTYFSDVHVMIFIGFAYLMTFLRKYGYGAAGFNFFLSAIILQWAVLVNGFWNNVQDDDRWHKIHIEVPALVEGDFAAASVMITFGAIIGKVNSLQLLLISLIEIVFYGVNKMIIEKLVHVQDIGGSMVIHTFGAYFGLTVAWIISPRKAEGHAKATPTVTSDMFALIGTIFLWMYWPSFNAALGTPGPLQQRAVVNTILALAASCVTAFTLSGFLRHNHKFDMVDIQNATLAGGVSCGVNASMAIWPGGAIGIGMGAGLISVLGYRYVQPFLEKHFHLHDTCGVHNLHGMPGVFGSLVSILVAGVATDDNYGSQMAVTFPQGDGAGAQAGYQAASLGITLGIAIVSGAFTALIALMFKANPNDMFDDEAHWHLPAEEVDVVVASNHTSSSDPSSPMALVPNPIVSQPNPAPATDLPASTAEPESTPLAKRNEIELLETKSH